MLCASVPILEGSPARRGFARLSSLSPKVSLSASLSALVLDRRRRLGFRVLKPTLGLGRSWCSIGGIWNLEHNTSSLSLSLGLGRELAATCAEAGN
jgi:hypothetical protein